MTPERLQEALATRYWIERELGQGGMGRRTPLFDIEELPGIATPFIASLSIADDGRSYVYFASAYNSLLFSVEGIR